MSPSELEPEFDYLQALRLDGKGVVVFGTGEGIGGHVVQAMAQAGARILCVDLDESAAARAAAAVGGAALQADITRRADIERALERARSEFGEDFAGIVDIVGIPLPGPIAQHDDAAVDREFNLVLRHALLAVQVGGPMLAARGGGFLIFVGSLAGLQVAPTVPLYGVMKAGLMALVEAAAHEFAPKGVRVNAVAPGRIIGSGKVRPSPQQIASIGSAIPMQRLGLPREIAGPILFLASDLASYITGQTIVADGGIGNLTALPPT